MVDDRHLDNFFTVQIFCAKVFHRPYPTPPVVTRCKPKKAGTRQRSCGLRQPYLLSDTNSFPESVLHETAICFCLRQFPETPEANRWYHNTMPCEVELRSPPFPFPSTTEALNVNSKYGG